MTLYRSGVGSCSGAHVGSCRVVFWRPLSTDALALAPAHLLMGGLRTWRHFPRLTSAAPLVVSFLFNREIYLDLLILVLWGSTYGDVLPSTGVHLPCCFRQPSTVAVLWLQTALWIILSCLRSARLLLSAFSTPSSPDG